MKIIPVIDVMGGVVVRAVGGRRSEYRPIQSRLTAATDLRSVAESLLPFATEGMLYIADLGAITGVNNHFQSILDVAHELDCKLLVDCGVRTVADFDWLPHHERIYPVLGSETLETPEVAGMGQVYEGNCVFSVDLMNGDLLGNWEQWHEYDVTYPHAVAQMAYAGWCLSGAGAVILLDLASVGERNGPGAERYCAEVRDRLPKHVKLIIGGGVRNWDDVRRLEDAGAAGVLVASALHDGTLVVQEALGVSGRSTPG